jgi:hypothetical protein
MTKLKVTTKQPNKIIPDYNANKIKIKKQGDMSIMVK